MRDLLVATFLYSGLFVFYQYTNYDVMRVGIKACEEQLKRETKSCKELKEKLHSVKFYENYFYKRDKPIIEQSRFFSFFDKITNAKEKEEKLRQEVIAFEKFVKEKCN